MCAHCVEPPLSCGAPLAGPSPLVPPQPRPKGYHSLDHSIDPYSIPAGRLLAGHKSVVLQCRSCGSSWETRSTPPPQGCRLAGARCTVKVIECVLYLSPRGPPAAVQSVLLTHVSTEERDRDDPRASTARASPRAPATPRPESPLRRVRISKTKILFLNTTMQHATDRHATQHTRTRRTFATHSPHAPAKSRHSRTPQGVGDVTSGLTFM